MYTLTIVRTPRVPFEQKFTSMDGVLEYLYVTDLMPSPALDKRDARALSVSWQDESTGAILNLVTERGQGRMRCRCYNCDACDELDRR